MGPIIAQVASLGYTAAQILQFLSGKVKGASQGIKSAKSQGYSDEDILKFLGSKFKTSKKSADNQLSANEEYLKNQGFKTKEEKTETRNKFIKGAFDLGAGALGTYALSRALPKTGQALQGQLLPALPQQPPAPQLPGGPRLGLPAPGQAAMQPPPPAGPQGPLPYTNPSAQNRPAPQPSQQPINVQPQQMPQQAPQTAPAAAAPASAITPLPKQLQAVVERVASSGNDPDQIEAYLTKFHPKEVKAYEKAANTPIRSAIEDFAKNLPAKATKTLANVPMEQESILQQPANAEIPRPIETQTPNIALGKQGLIEQGKKKFEEQMNAQEVPEPTEHLPKKEKGSTVALPNGEIGEISEIRQGIATVEAPDGKKYTRKLDELIESPLAEKELHELFDDLVEGIKKETGQEISRAINYVGFNPDEKSLIVHYIGSGKDTYTFDDLDEGRINRLMELEQMRRTSGQNYVGGWEEGTKSILGSKIHDLVKELEEERGGKGKAHSFTYKTLYDAMEPAKYSKEQAHKKKMAEKKLLKEKENEAKRKAKKPRPH